MNVLLNIYPERAMYHFENICKIPHGSGNTKQISDYCVEFAKVNGLKYVQDELNNVIIYKDATSDMQGSAPVIIQGHLDMVCAQEDGCKKNMSIEGLDIIVEEGFIKAKGTTLGGDDGIAIAFALAILESKDISHPPIEAVFTVDEETGLFGAIGIDLSENKAKRLINIDSEEEGILTAGCAGGGRVEIITRAEWDEAKGRIFNLEVSELIGGHSGVEINKGRANANVVMIGLLNYLCKDVDFRIIELNGGDKDNAIAANAKAQIVVLDEFLPEIDEYVEQIKKEYPVEKNIKITCTEGKSRNVECLTEQSTLMLIGMLSEMPNGVQKMSSDIDGLVQTSLNFGSIRTKNDSIISVFSVRSSVKSEMTELIEMLCKTAMLFGSSSDVSGEYPAWEFAPVSSLRDTMCKVYKEMFNKELKVDVIHAGLECGILCQKISELDAVSIGPDIIDIHTPKEKLSIESVARTWAFLLAVLKEL